MQGYRRFLTSDWKIIQTNVNSGVLITKVTKNGRLDLDFLHISTTNTI